MRGPRGRRPRRISRAVVVAAAAAIAADIAVGGEQEHREYRGHRDGAAALDAAMLLLRLDDSTTRLDYLRGVVAY